MVVLVRGVSVRKLILTDIGEPLKIEFPRKLTMKIGMNTTNGF
tara:strand:+ start:190 stop:318 length:129 start_codon:yes stop_codon:yes gene_type:complete